MGVFFGRFIYYKRTTTTHHVFPHFPIFSHIVCIFPPFLWNLCSFWKVFSILFLVSLVVYGVCGGVVIFVTTNVIIEVIIEVIIDIIPFVTTNITTRIITRITTNITTNVTTNVTTTPHHPHKYTSIFYGFLWFFGNYIYKYHTTTSNIPQYSRVFLGFPLIIYTSSTPIFPGFPRFFR